MYCNVESIDHTHEKQIKCMELEIEGRVMGEQNPQPSWKVEVLNQAGF